MTCKIKISGENGALVFSFETSEPSQMKAIEIDVNGTKVTVSGEPELRERE